MKILYKTKTCGRCGGSGSYSWNAMHGSVCYGCNGTGKKLTPLGVKARAAVAAWKMAHSSVPVKDLKPGDRFWDTNGWRTVISTSTEGGSRYFKDGEWVDYFTVTHKGGSHGFCKPDDRVLVPLGSKFVELAEFARTLKGVTISE